MYQDGMQMYPNNFTGGQPQAPRYGYTYPQPALYSPTRPAMPTQAQPPVNYPAQPQNGFKVFPVASIDEAVASPTDFMGNVSVMTDFSHGYIYTKVLDSNTGSSVFQKYKRELVEGEEQSAQAPAPYDAKAEIEALKNEVAALKKELGINGNESS